MLINWFTVLAQAINFLILVWLLKRFLYKPVLHAIDEREKGIATQLAEATAAKAEAKKDRDDLQHKNEALEQERAALLKKATDDAGVERQRLLDDAHKDADALRASRQAGLASEQCRLNAEIVRWTQKEVFAITRKALADLANTSLEVSMSDVFVRQIHALTGAARDQLSTAFKTSNHTVSVHTAFDLPAAQQSAIETAVKETFAPGAQVRFETAPDLVGGIELSTNGHKVAWSIKDYLATLEKSAGELLNDGVNSQAKVEVKPQPGPNGAGKVEPKAAARPEPRRGGKNGPVPASSAPKGDH